MNCYRLSFLFCLSILFVGGWNTLWAQNYGSRDAILVEELIFQTAPFPSCHASSLVETKAGTLMATWFGGYRERHKRVGIWISRYQDGRWMPPVEIANGLQETGDYIPTWNPVLFQPKDGPLLLFFKVGPSPEDWWGEMIVSYDDGLTWTERHKLGDKIIGPVRCKPFELESGEILCPSSDETDDQWITHMERTADYGKTWSRSIPLHTPEEAQTIQPTLLIFPSKEKMTILCRDGEPTNSIWQSWSYDGGASWSKFVATQLPNPNAGIDSVALSDGRFLLLYNHTKSKGDDSGNPTGRSMMNLAISNDAQTWDAACIFENSPGEEFSYPAIIQTSDGLVHLTYTWKRTHIKHVVLDPKKLTALPMPNGQWPR